MTDSKCGGQAGGHSAECLAQSPQLTRIGAGPQSSLASQANNRQFANYNSITNTEVSVFTIIILIGEPTAELHYRLSFPHVPQRKDQDSLHPP